MSKKEKIQDQPDKVYNFGEKTKEKLKVDSKFIDLDVWQTPKYKQSRDKAIELIEAKKYGLDEGDFWILKNKGGDKLCYTGLIISHNGCLKINDQLEDKMKFKPSSVEIVKDEGDKVKVMRYINDEQGIYEFGEISPKNCMNDYPYAMVLKRLMDRVILKASKVGFFGIYSDSESEDFKEKPENDNEEKKELTRKEALNKMADAASEDMGKILEDENQKQFRRIKESIENCGSVAELQSIWGNEKSQLNKLKKYAENLFKLLTDSKDHMRTILDPENQEAVNDIHETLKAG